MELYQIIEVNEPQQYLMLNSWIVERWVDSMLGWDPNEFEGTTEIMLPHHKIWLPDTTLYNSLVMDEGETRRLLNAKLTTVGNGSGAFVELLYPTIYKLSCNLDLRFFPFDVQDCTLIFGKNEGWKVLWTEVTRKEVKYDCCPNNYTLLIFEIHIQRKPLYYVINLILPTSIITLISIVGFFSSSSINEVRQEKITLGITTLLSMSILILMVSDKMPSTSSFIPLIGWFYTAMILLISVATISASVVIYIQKRGIIGIAPPPRVMWWARRIGRLVRMELPLLMKQAYAQKAREEKLRNAGRKQSLWQKVYKMSKVVNAFGNQNTNGSVMKPTIKPKSFPNLSIIKSGSEPPVTQKKSLAFSIDDRDMTPMIDDEETPEEMIRNIKPAKRLRYSQSSVSYDNVLENMVEGKRLGEISSIISNTARRDLAQLEYDWLAAVFERICLIFFIVMFILMSFGINGIGAYYWKNAVNDRIMK
ncbi:unnamed protein product, partial [Mesorhabditis belari]|uniref:Neurotransmitter-gated ion-channel transmembrane domain-containing protein n=1 Tax=Mesorhabditis belari TaxID=2138241 RepID=A0AAF3EUU1_9BILA